PRAGRPDPPPRTTAGTTPRTPAPPRAAPKAAPGRAGSAPATPTAGGRGAGAAQAPAAAAASRSDRPSAHCWVLRTTLMSVRRLSARPSSVELGAMGLAAPCPTATKRCSGRLKFDTRYFLTDSARRCESVLLAWAFP